MTFVYRVTLKIDELLANIVQMQTDKFCNVRASKGLLMVQRTAPKLSSKKMRFLLTGSQASPRLQARWKR